MARVDKAADPLTERIDVALRSHRLGAWETRFLQDMRTKITRHGGQQRLTPRQIQKLDEVLARSSRAALAHAAPGRHGWIRRGRRRWRTAVHDRHLRRSLVLLSLMLAIWGIHQIYARFAQVPSWTVPAAMSQQAGSGVAITGAIHVIDGDTVEVNGEHFRLVGFNTPETFEPRCAAELALGTRAKERLRQLLGAGTPLLLKVPCACPPGSEGTKRCNHGRSCGVLSVNGTDVAGTLIAEKLAAPFQCGSTGCPRLPRPWCGEG